MGKTTYAFNSAVAWSPDGRLIAGTTSADANFGVPVLELFVDASSGDHSFHHRTTLRGHDSTPVRLAFSNDGKILASAGWDGQTILWDPFQGKALISTSGLFCRFGPQDKHLSYSSIGSIGVWDVARSFEYRRLECPDDSRFVREVAISKDDRWLVSTGADGAIRFWNAQSGEELSEHYGFGGFAVAISPDGNQLITSGPVWLHKWPIETVDRESVTEVRVGPPSRISVDARPLRFTQSDDGRTLAFYDHSGQIVVIHDGVERPLYLVGGEIGRGLNVALSPNGKLVAHGTWDDSIVTIWNAVSGEPLKELPAGRGAQVAFSPDGRLFAAVSRQQVQLWNVDDWTVVTTYQETSAPHPTGCVDFAHNAPLLAATYPAGMIQLIESNSGRRIAILEPPDRELLTSLRFNGDGTKLAAATEGGIIHLWDLREARHRLSEIHLDWDLPPLPPAKEPSRKPLRVTVLGLDDGSGQEENIILLRYRAESYALQSLWEEASAEFRHLIDIDRDNHFWWMRFSPILVHLGDEQGYRRLRREMLDLFGDSQAPITLERMTKACSLAPLGADDRQTLAKMAERATEVGQGTPDFHWMCLARGLAEYRLGNHQASIEWLHQSLETGGTQLYLPIMARLTLAMALAQVGDDPEALSELSAAQRILDSRYAKPDAGRLLDDRWHDLLTCWILRAEAEKVVAEMSSAGAAGNSAPQTP